MTDPVAMICRACGHPAIVCDVMNGKYASGFPPSLLAVIGVRKETVYALVEDAKERAA